MLYCNEGIIVRFSVRCFFFHLLRFVADRSHPDEMLRGLWIQSSREWTALVQWFWPRFPTNHCLESSIESLRSFTHRPFFLCSDDVVCMPSPLRPDDLNWSLEKSKSFCLQCAPSLNSSQPVSVIRPLGRNTLPPSRNSSASVCSGKQGPWAPPLNYFPPKLETSLPITKASAVVPLHGHVWLPNTSQFHKKTNVYMEY